MLQGIRGIDVQHIKPRGKEKMERHRAKHMVDQSTSDKYTCGGSSVHTVLHPKKTAWLATMLEKTLQAKVRHGSPFLSEDCRADGIGDRAGKG